MSSISSLRNKIQTQFLNNNIISGREAKEMVSDLAKDGLSAEEKQALVQMREEFKDNFSAAGLRDFDKALARVPVSTDTSAPENGSSVLNVQLGRDMSGLTSDFKLSEIRDPAVRGFLERIDVNTDGRVNERDRKKMGFSEQQWQTLAFSALLMGQGIKSDAQIPHNLEGKTVAFTAVDDYEQLTQWAEKMGATISTKVTPDLDYLFVGDKDRTGKDERALILNTLGEADITVTNAGRFHLSAHDAGVTGAGPTTVSREEYSSKMESTLKDWYTEYITEGYDYELSGNLTGAERRSLIEDRQNDLDSFSLDYIEGDEIFSDYIYDRYDSGEPYLDDNGLPIPQDELDIINFSFFTDLAGIGLSKTFVFDRRTGDVVDEGDIND